MITDIDKKIDALCKGAEEKLRISYDIAAKGDFGTATALLVTAFEERTKAVVLQFIDLGLPLTEHFSNIEYIFRQHDARHYIGFIVDCIHEVIEDLITLMNQLRGKKEQIKKMIKFSTDQDTQEKLGQWILKKIDSFCEKIDFYQNIEKKRQNGLYIDILEHGTVNQKLEQNDYLFVKQRLNSVHILSSNLSDMKNNNADQDQQLSIEEAKQRMIETNTPDYIKDAIKLVKKERNKAFNQIRNKLLEIKQAITEDDFFE